MAALLRNLALLQYALWRCAVAVANDLYTSNAVCRSNYCTNPIFPGLNDLPRLEQLSWQCSSHSLIQSYMSFCKDVVYYDSALPSPNSSSAAVNALVKAQDDAASTMFFYHLNGMGYDAWDFQDPSKITDPCVKSVQEMVCYTYFPKSQAGCQMGQAVSFQRPCMNVCGNYLQKCQVECCDESAACVFQNTMDVGGVAMVQTGYVDLLGPSNLCTGSGSTGLRAPVLLLLGLIGLHMTASSSGDSIAPTLPSANTRLALLGIMLSLTVTLHGCDLDVQQHNTGNWRGSSDYLIRHQYIPPQLTAADAVLNSCSMSSLSPTQQCSGRGYCKAWNPAASGSLSFCVCDRDYADPECRTQRKSQTKAFFLSLFGGFLGLDYFYLGFPLWGVGKLFTLGGLGFWWLTDIVRTGSGPIYSHDYRVAADLPHWVYACVTLSFFLLIGFLLAIYFYMTYRGTKRDNVLKLQAAEESRSVNAPQQYGMEYKYGATQNYEGRRGFSGYGATLPVPHPNAEAPYAVPPGPGEPMRFAGPYGPAGVPGMGYPQSPM